MCFWALNTPKKKLLGINNMWPFLNIKLFLRLWTVYCYHFIMKIGKQMEKLKQVYSKYSCAHHLDSTM